MRTLKTGSLRGLLVTAALFAAAGAAANACSASGQGADSDQGGSDSSGGSPTSGGSGGSGAGGSLFNDAGSPTGAGGGLDSDAACASVSATAEAALQPADIIIAVDTSGSMDEESGEVQANLNNFATLITASGIDVHVILIADSSVCIPAPLGSGSCGGADEKLPNYRHVNQGVASSNALQLIISTYPQWKDSLRWNATKTFAVVSDDESAISAAEFTNQLLALDPPTFQGFKFDAIVAFEEPNPLTCFGFGSCPAGASQCCGLLDGIACGSYAAAEGKVYKQLVQQTGGVLGDLCIQDFDPVFQNMATGVVKDSKLSCDYSIPPVPDGETFEPGKVNVVYTPGGGGAPESIFNVPGGAADCGMKGGWYYDDPKTPAKILMCPSTCSTLQADAAGKIDILFGCATQTVPPA
ncbi:MAG: VWA domain-containing protein [Polyangiaceae bacterium]|nr:hypothetical protein [Polyangiaceae bacterium]NUQ73809.1 VWA domain-containing protein [Polyangiaceae bacterium]